MRNLEALLVVVAFAHAGCALTARTSLGPSVSPAGFEERASAGFGVGLADDKGQIMLVGAAQPGTRSVVGVGGIEYDRNLRSESKPLGIRVRVEGGAQAEYTPHAPENDAVSAIVAAVPGVWWIPFQSVYDAHRFVMAIEPRIGAAIPADDPGAAGPFFDVALVMQWDWVPCTFFGAGSCLPKDRMPPAPPRARPPR